MIVGGYSYGSFDLSKDGTTVVMGGTALDDEKGQVLVYRENAGDWILEATLSASNKGDGDRFGHSVSINENGTLIAVGANGEDSSLSGINNSGTDNDSAINSGAVYLFRKGTNSWIQEAYIKSDYPDGDESGTSASASVPNPETLNAGSGGTGGDQFGFSVSLSSDGNFLAVSSLSDDSASEGVFSSQQNDNDAISVGAVHLYEKQNNVWSLVSFIKPSWNGVSADDQFYNHVLKYRGLAFGQVVDLDDDGNTLLVTAEKDDGKDEGVVGISTEMPDETWSGAAYVYTRSSDSWVESAYLKATNPRASDFCGDRGAISGDGNVVAIGAEGEDYNSNSVHVDTGIPNRSSSNNGLNNSGAVYVYRLSGGSWGVDAMIKAPNSYAGAKFSSVALDTDGELVNCGSSRNIF